MGTATPHLVPLGSNGAVLFKGWLDHAAQAALAEYTFTLAAEVNAAWESAANAQRHPYIVLSYDRAAPARAKDCVRACGLNQCSGACGRPTCPEEPTFLFELAEQAVCRGREWQEKNPEAGVSLPEWFHPSTCWALCYKQDDSMPAHLDRAEGWTLSVSVGAAVDFVVGRRPEKGSTYGEFAPHKPFAHQTEQHVLFESGDLFLFRGDREFHAVDGTRAGTAPAFWGSDVIIPEGLARVGLLFRDGH